MKRHKILYVHHGGIQGGAPLSLQYLLKGLDREKFEPMVGCNYSSSGVRQFFEKEGFRTVDVPSACFLHIWPSGWWPLYSPRKVVQLFKWILLQQPASAKKFYKALSEVQPDIVHLNSLTIAPLARIAKKRGFKVVLHVRESASIKGHFGVRWRWLRRLALNWVDQVIYICRANRDMLTGSFKNATVIYNPIPFDRFDCRLDEGEIREKLKIPLEAVVLFFPGGSVLSAKGIYPFLQALAKLRKQCSNVVTIIPGIATPPRPFRNFDRRKMERIIRKKGLEDAVFRLPFSHAVEEYFAASDIIVSPFIVPHFSRAAIEAGAMCRPVVGSRIGGIEEVVEDGVTGLLSAPGDVRELTEKLLRLIQSPKMRRAFGMEGYVRACERYRVERHAQSVMQVYNKLLSKEE